MQNKLFYPAIFHTAEEGGFWVSFPDFPECLTEGDDMTQAYEMAVDALGLAITSREQAHEEIPTASNFVIEFDLLSYRKRNNSRSVKKTLTIPEWLNEAATAAGINFSQVLQEALMQKVGM